MDTEGTKYFYKEDDETLPVNVYTSSKLSNFTKGLFCSLISSSRVADVRDYFQLELHLLHWVFQCYVCFLSIFFLKFMVDIIIVLPNISPILWLSGDFCKCDIFIVA
ncbi:uncharacterized protein LOC107843979 isoform X10 [Capsicum annuum]|uniref:uncharacterized protein LOC107843979 isoform X10 n=1 Tax=Capsicum annuum TaxID=4072 RepID=UPI001FB0C8F2|nr:uncharacterized protein LOC107843979 isoform X10 [Capsicum annuum]